MRWVLCCVVWCLMCQGLTVSVERVRGRAHLHLDTPQGGALPSFSAHAMQHLADLDGHRYAPGIASDDTAEQRRPAHAEHDDEHRLSGIAHHDHDATADGVVPVGEDDATSALNPHPTWARSVHDLDGLRPSFDRPADNAVAITWARGAARSFASHVSSPPERPPRA